MQQPREQYTPNMSFKTHKLKIASVEIQTALRNASESFSHFSILETGSSLIESPEVLDRYDFLCAGGSVKNFIYPIADSKAWYNLKSLWRSCPSWWFGILSYDLKNALEKSISSRHPSNLNFPEIVFFEPQWVVVSKKGVIQLHIHESLNYDSKDWWENILRRGKVTKVLDPGIEIIESWRENDYLERAERIKEWINLGDIYEANLCFPFKGIGNIDRMDVYQRLFSKTKASMAGYYQTPTATLISASPERYLCVRKESNETRIYSQPIKGTSPRGKNHADDIRHGNDLRNSKKERSENTMIVDIVRNDISRVAKERSVKVDRYLELRKLPTVFHLVSTVGGVLKDNLDWLNTIEATFPMGSMTGAPKIRAMERIDSQESGRRGWYSGALGYVAPNGECDFNVVIRSLMYESKTDKWISWAGSALTLDADPKKEWEEINLKMDAPKHVLNFNK